ncbi:MAG: hypothetical protein QM500_13470 [Methylococcales bacterium]
MYQLLTLVFNICLFKKGPQDMPVAKALLFLLIPVYFCISLLVLILSMDFIHAVFQTLVELALLLGFVKGVLFFAKKPARYQQTASALIATDSLISFFATPVMATLIGEGSAISIISIIALMIWHWLVSGHIFSQALEKPFTFGLGLALLYILVSSQVMGLIFPQMVVIE